MHEVRAIAIDNPSVRRSVSLAGERSKTIKRIDALFGVKTTGDSKNIGLDGGSHISR